MSLLSFVQNDPKDKVWLVIYRKVPLGVIAGQDNNWRFVPMAIPFHGLQATVGLSAEMLKELSNQIILLQSQCGELRN